MNFLEKKSQRSIARSLDLTLRPQMNQEIKRTQSRNLGADLIEKRNLRRVENIVKDQTVPSLNPTPAHVVDHVPAVNETLGSIEDMMTMTTEEENTEAAETAIIIVGIEIMKRTIGRRGNHRREETGMMVDLGPGLHILC